MDKNLLDDHRDCQRGKIVVMTNTPIMRPTKQESPSPPPENTTPDSAYSTYLPRGKTASLHGERNTLSCAEDAGGPRLAPKAKSSGKLLSTFDSVATEQHRKPKMEQQFGKKQATSHVRSKAESFKQGIMEAQVSV